jgi:hypothetical protein
MGRRLVGHHRHVVRGINITTTIAVRPMTWVWLISCITQTLLHARAPMEDEHLENSRL